MRTQNPSGTAGIVGSLLIKPRSPSQPFARDGGSGCLVIVKKHVQPVELCFYAIATGRYVLANPLQPLLDESNAELLESAAP